VGAKKQTRKAAEHARAQIEARRSGAAAAIAATVQNLGDMASEAHQHVLTARNAAIAEAETIARRGRELDAAHLAVTTAASTFRSHARQQVGELDRQRASVAAHLDDQCEAAVARLHARVDAALVEIDDAITRLVDDLERRSRNVAAPVEDSVEPPRSDPDVDTARAEEPEVDPELAAAVMSAPTAPEPATTTTLLAERAPASPISVRVDASTQRASLAHQARSAADGWIKTELLHASAHGRSTTLLRLVAREVSGWWEQHELPCEVSAFARRCATFDLAELRNAIDFEYADDGVVTVEFGDDVTVGTTLVLASNASVEYPVGTRRKVERVDLQRADREGLVLDSQVGRLVVPSRLVSLLRSRQALEGDLLTIDDRPFLSARVAGPTPEVPATITAPLAAELLPEVAPDRRVEQDSPVSQLLTALSSHSTPDELVAILRNGVGYARRRAAAHPALPEGLIDAVLRDGTEAMRCAAASNPSIAVAAIERAVGDAAPAVRAAVAANGNVPPVNLVRLARDDDQQVRRRVVDNPTVSHELLAMLATDGDPTVRAAVAAHERCPDEAFASLARDAYPGVCAAVAENAACPVELLDELLAVAPEVVLANPRAPEHLLVAGSQVRSRAIRVAVAGNPATPARQLQLLVRDSDPVVAAAVAANPNASASTRRRARRAATRVTRAAKADGPTEPR
jgi:hypothetical protein